MPEPEKPLPPPPSEAASGAPQPDDVDQVAETIAADFSDVMRWLMDERVLPSLHWALEHGATDTSGIRRALAESLREVADFIENDENWSA